MNRHLIAKKYVQALLTRVDLDEFYTNLSLLNSAFLVPKFKTIVESNQIKKEKKIELLQSFFEKSNQNFLNFLTILTYNSRLICIPEIVEELRKQKSLKENLFLGQVFSKEPLDEATLEKLESKLNTKFNVKIKLTNQITHNDGVKISLEELGYEISFSAKMLQEKMTEFVLKII
ncbi:F0F1 ATP synthase subunit delta [Campylobacter sp. MIT 21-1685]|uniref:F0F1 ATP synthase subunit delta n=1 Tax=unclassified Campylobacter TaxID=2593542 RepID=UPI00224B0AE1|nr:MULTISPECIES: F0F1 ATP synthase subunit delta [unclassified Campylobacter]MCX2683336.1 F0F1 ATP synthase subunit delta [Campylobacter sp. MIT 21-1684]MCX2751609.1 F0F1 ATP synthase subunit delta [Campylobacter sp. MIT 21-1682]MCX2807808.1 F0F1 ATP synthase subunit delta [Campylobacter sp. MIT 21-1685]